MFWVVLPVLGVAAVGAWLLSRGDEKEADASPEGIGGDDAAHQPAPVPPEPVVVIKDGPVVSIQAPTQAHQDVAQAAADAAQVRDWQAAQVSAWASGDLAQVEQVAREMKTDGMTAEAALLLEAVARKREVVTEDLNAIRVAEGHPPVTAAEVAAEEPAPLPATPDPRIAIAGQLMKYLRTTSKGNEDKASVKAAQVALGLTSTDADGLYGITTATTAANLGVVPVPPWYTPKINTAARIATFVALMRSYAETDPPRAAQWYYVANVMEG